MQSGGNVDDYLTFLSDYHALLTYDGTPTNKGSLGYAANGTGTGITLDAAGMRFDGATSRVVIPNLAGWADVINSGGYTIAAQAIAFSVGANNSGRIHTVGATTHTLSMTTTPTLVPTVARAGVVATSSTTNPITAYPSTNFLEIYSFDGNAISGHSAKAGETTLTAGADSNGSGDITAVGVNTLVLGNRLGNDRGLDGYIRLWTLIPSVLTLAERNEFLALMQPLLNA